MNRIAGAALAALGLVAGVGMTIGVMKGTEQWNSVQREIKDLKAQVQQSPSAAIAQQLQPASASTVQVAQPVEFTPARFEDLPLCDQLDGIAKAGKSVAQFIADSGLYGEFAANVTANCNWHQEQVKIADSILNPPIVTIPTVTVSSRQNVVLQDEPIVTNPAPSSSWNNCNGIQEPGESYSSSCASAQEKNDNTWGWRDPEDNRDWNRGGWDGRGNTSDDVVPRDYNQGYKAK